MTQHMIMDARDSERLAELHAPFLKDAFRIERDRSTFSLGVLAISKNEDQAVTFQRAVDRQRSLLAELEAVHERALRITRDFTPQYPMTPLSSAGENA